MLNYLFFICTADHYSHTVIKRSANTSQLFFMLALLSCIMHTMLHVIMLMLKYIIVTGFDKSQLVQCNTHFSSLDDSCSH